jgi:hypothetical protein
VDGDIALNRDVAEQFESAGDFAPGSVMVIGEGSKLQLCSQPYDKRAVGVISGAGELKPGITPGDNTRLQRRCLSQW